MAKRVITAEITSRELKLAEFVKTSGRWQLNKWGREKLSAATADETAGALNSLLNKLNLRAREAVFSVLDYGQVFQLVELPPLPPEEARPAIRYKLEPLLNFPLDQAVFDFQKIPLDGKNLYLTAVISKQTLAILVEAAKKAGLALKRIAPAACAFLSVLPEKSQANIALVYLGGTAANISIAKEKQLVFAREISPDLANLAAEARSTFDYYKEQTNDAQPINEIILAGEGALVPGVLETLRTLPGLKTSLFQHELLPGEEAPVLAGLLGALSANPEGLSFTARRSSAPTGRLKKYAGFFSAAVIFLLAVSLAFGWLAMRKQSLERRLKDASSQLSQVEAAIGGGTLTEKTATKIISQINARPGRTDTFVSLVNLLEQKTPDGIYFEGISYNRLTQRLLIKGLVVRESANKRVTSFITGLKQSPLLESVKLNFLVESSRFTTPTFEFELDCGLAGGVL